MNKSIEHRGPDAHGVNIINGNIGLGHQRLSIIDLDNRSNQPMTSNSSDSILVFNGEIFNFKSIKNELITKYEFHTKSDTEVIIAAYETMGLDWFLSKANGMFAFAIYDKKKKKIVLAKDRFGIKPLFYYISDNTLIFSSEIKGLLHSGLVEPEFNESAIDEYLGYRYIREPFTFFRNVKQVRSATYLEIDEKFQVNEKSYWNLPRLNFDENYDSKTIISNTDKKIRSAIERWLIADVRVGAYLSGGVDSSLTTAILCKSLPGKQIDTFTIGFDEPGFNEFEYARIVSELYSTNHREIILNQNEYFDTWEELIGYKDAPLAVPNEIPLAIMTKSLSKDITVVISGEGADELFGGYGRIYRSAFDFNNHRPKKSFYEYFIDQYEYTPRLLRDQYLCISKPLRNHFDKIESKNFRKYPNEENIFRFFQNHHIKGLLNRVDMTTMQTSIEARPPFLDHELIEYVYSHVPYRLKLKWKDEQSEIKAKNLYSKSYSEVLDTPKYILKKVSEAYLPNEVIYRKKVGFPVPLTKWFPHLETIALDQLKNVDWLNKGVIQDLCNNLKSSKSAKSGQLLWMFLNVEKFKNLYFNKTWKW